ncbi:hypothetical protein MHYP_G00281480 [Metynnis hypsauchen]
MSTFVREGLSWSATSQSPPGCNAEWLVTKIQETSVVNVYKPPLTALTISSLPPVPAPAIYAEPPSFFSACWNSYTNPDLAFCTDLKPERHVLDRFPRSHHRPSIIKVPSLVQPVAGLQISQLCVPYKILERVIHSHTEPVVDPQLPWEQASFPRGKSTVDQVTLLTQDIEDSFQDNEKAGVVFLDLTAVYDIVSHRGLHLKMLRTIPDWHMVRFIMEMLVNRSFIVHTSNGQTVPQSSVLSPVLFNIYIHNLPDTISTKYGYADDLAIMLRCPTWKAVEDGLNRDMVILADCLKKWHLQLNVGKTVAAAYHLNNWEARRELDVYVGKNRVEFQQVPKYLGVCLDWTLSYKQHLDEVKAKVTARVLVICRLAGSTWGASPRPFTYPCKPLSYPQPNTVPLPGTEVHM